MASRALHAIGEIAKNLGHVRRDPLGALDILSPPTNATVLTDLPYGPEDGQRLDLFLRPALENPPLRSAVLYFHGGRWSYGRKEEYAFVARALCARGHVVAVCDYRKFPQVCFPAFVEDAATAIAWALAQLPGYGVDPRLIFSMGHSAGAHMAALAAMDQRYGRAFGFDPDALAGLVLLSGPYDFFPIRGEDLREIFGPEQAHPETQPLRYARAGLPPMLFLHGRRDRTVRPSSSARMASAIRDAGGQARVVFYNHLSHTDILATLSDGIGFLLGPVLGDISAFLRTRIGEVDKGRISTTVVEPSETPDA